MLLASRPSLFMSLSVIPGVLLAHELFAFGDDAAVVSDAAATTESEMKPYAEVIDHTDVVIDMLPIRGGKFVMGSPAGEQDRNNDEGPQHEVEVAPFWMGKYEITWNQYEIWGESIDISRRKIYINDQ